MPHKQAQIILDSNTPLLMTKFLRKTAALPLAFKHTSLFTHRFQKAKERGLVSKLSTLEGEEQVIYPKLDRTSVMELGADSQVSPEHSDPYSTQPTPNCPLNIHPYRAKRNKDLLTIFSVYR